MFHLISWWVTYHLQPSAPFPSPSWIPDSWENASASSFLDLFVQKSVFLCLFEYLTLYRNFLGYCFSASSWGFCLFRLLQGSFLGRLKTVAKDLVQAWRDNCDEMPWHAFRMYFCYNCWYNLLLSCCSRSQDPLRRWALRTMLHQGIPRCQSWNNVQSYKTKDIR